MLLDYLFGGMLTVFTWLINIVTFPTDQTATIATWLVHSVHFISMAGNFFPLSILGVVIANIIAWTLIHFVISTVRFILDFIPLW